MDTEKNECNQTNASAKRLGIQPFVTGTHFVKLKQMQNRSDERLPKKPTSKHSN
jgi:hypothetical protein